MRLLPLLVSAVLAVPLSAPVLAQDAIPSKRLTLIRDTDLPGQDIQSYFDTTYEACSNACLADSQCKALTFNQRSNACFLKSGADQMVDFTGALSAKVFTSDPAVLQRASLRKAELVPVLGEYMLDQARTFSMRIGEEFQPGSWSLQQVVDAATEARAQGNTRDAVLYLGAAMAISDRADLFNAYADLMLDYPGSNSERRNNNEKSTMAAIGAYLRAGTAAERQNALLTLSIGLERTGRTQQMVPVLRLAESIQARADVSDALSAARAKYGFRIVDNRVESDLASPRICATFSEEVLSGGSDYASYVTVDKGEAVVTSEWRDICVEGMEHGRDYEVTFRPGLTAASGETLVTPATLRFYVRDRAPMVWFPGRGYILPATGEVSLPIMGVNVPEVELELSRVSDRNLLRAIQNDYFGQPISYYERREFDNQVAEKIWSGTGRLETRINEEVTTRLPLDGVLEGLDPGIYVLAAQVPGVDPWDNPAATQWFVVSDMGLTSYSGNDGLHVFIRSLSDAGAKPGAQVQLVNRSNAVLATGTTDETGYIRFDAGLTRGTGGSEPAMLVVEQGDDMSFLPLTDPEFDLSDRGVEGRAAAGPIDVFLTTDRGIYRAGETINVTALTRDAKVRALTGLPLTAVLYRPDGVEYSRVLASGEVAGGYVFNLPVAGNAQRGSWRLDLLSDPKAAALASQRVLVEDFLPERIDFDLSLGDQPLIPGGAVELTVDARYLFGAPGADLKVEGYLHVTETRSLDRFPGYVFGRHDRSLQTHYEPLYFDGPTDEDGHAALDLTLPEMTDAAAPLRATVVLQVAEGSGRPVERRTNGPMQPSGPVIGIKPMFDGELAENARAEFQLIALDSDLEPTPMTVKWSVSRVNTSWRWYRMYGYWNWEPVTTRVMVAEGEAELGAVPATIGAQVGWGQYEIRVERADGEYTSASTSFYAGWYVSGDTSKSPDVLEAGLDKADYRPGETAVLRIVPRYAGKALVTVLSDRLIHSEIVDVIEGENRIPVPVTEEWGAGAYVTASVIRPMDGPAGKMPARALGLAYAAVDPGDARLDVSVELAAEVDPRGPMPVAVKVANVQPGDTAWVTIAAMDIGILNITGYTSPDPAGYYFGQRMLGVGIRDVYGRLIDASQGAMGQVRSGGDGGAMNSMENPPPPEELVAYFVGPIQVDADGYARHTFDLPSFNGTVRVMAVAWSSGGVGQAEAEALVRDPVVVTASVPRFMAPGDQSRLLLEVVHVFGPAGQMRLDLAASGVDILQSNHSPSVTLAEQGKATLSIPILARDPSLAELHVRLTTPDGKILDKSLKLPVQINDPEVSRTSRFDLAAGQTFTLDDNVFAGMMPGSGTATLSVGPLAYLDAPGLLVSLDRYPYGCTEQTTSRALPLLYLSSLSAALGMQEKEDLTTRIELSIQRVLSNQSSTGSFGLWYADSGDYWLDAYVTDFLSRARAQGYKVPEQSFRMAISNLRNWVSYQADFDKGGEALAYSLMVLAREGAAAIGDLRYYADQKADSFSTPLAQAQIGAALAMYGDSTRADMMFRKAVQALRATPVRSEGQIWRADYGTSLRDTAGVLTLAVEAGSQVVDRDAMAAAIAPQQHRYLSTQEQVWTLLAANALAGSGSAEGITINGQSLDGPLVKVLEQETDGGLAVAVHNGSANKTMLTLTTFGVPEVPEPAGGNGYAIKRDYFSIAGEPVDPSSVPSGTRLVVRLSVQAFGSNSARLLLDDPLPAGFEIDNPNILQSGDISALDWLDLNAAPRHSEFRQERFITQVDWGRQGTFHVAYIVRAISPGSYHHPAASVEDMYRPQFRAHTDTGRITVTE